MARINPEKICTRQRLTNSTQKAFTVSWPAARIASAQVGSQFTSSFCCTEEMEEKEAPLTLGDTDQTAPTKVHAGELEQDDEYPDLVEADAKTLRTSFVGKLWDGSAFINVDVEFRAAASHPHFNQSVFQFVIIDQSEQALSIDWDLVGKMSKTMEPYVAGSPDGGKSHRQTIVFFGKEKPAPVEGVVVLKTSTGKLLGRLIAPGFINQK